MSGTKSDLYDVIIVGAGPAGSILAYELALKSMRVCIIEKAKLPRYKPCGGGLQVKAAKLLPFDISKVIEDTVYGFSFTADLKNEFCRQYNEPLIHMVSRQDFDYLLTEEAVRAGADLVQEEEVSSIRVALDDVLITTKKGLSLKAEILVGADGARSVVAKNLGLKDAFQYDVALEAEIPVSEKDLDKFKHIVRLDWGAFPGGYCWAFPKKDHLSVGVGGPSELGKHLKGIYGKWLKHLNLTDLQDAQISGHMLKFRLNKESKITLGRVVLIGEASGLVDVFTGEGLYYAIKSAQIAAPIIVTAVRENISYLDKYQDMVDREFMPELLSAQMFLKIFNLAPSLVHNFIKRSPRAWRAFCRVMRGEKTYIGLEEEFGPFQFLWRPLESISNRAFYRHLKKWKQ